MTNPSRRRFIHGGGLALAALGAGGPLQALAQSGKTLTIAYNVDLPSWDPTVGPSAVNPTIQSLYKAVFSQYIDQNPDLSLKPDLLTAWGWNADKSKAVVMEPYECVPGCELCARACRPHAIILPPRSLLHQRVEDQEHRH